jgi:structural maintenance of chromosome 1
MADDSSPRAAAAAAARAARDAPPPEDDDAYALGGGDDEDLDAAHAAANDDDDDDEQPQDQQQQQEPLLPELTTAQGRIDRLEVRDFKSYRGEHVIGPFRAFTAVVGPNGSGKSNLMDAISFVLGVRTAQLRGSLKELLYAYNEPTTAGAGAAGGGAAGSNKGKGAANANTTTPADRPQAARSASVTLVYDDGQGGEVRFMRAIVPAGRSRAAAAAEDDDDGAAAAGTSAADDANYQSQYRIDDQRVTWDAYARRLGSFGILVKVRNFLVFQGDIERVATLPPEGLSALVEQVSGSEEFARPYSEAEQAKQRADERAALAFQKRKAVGAERRQKKEQRDEAERHLKLERELREARTYWRLWQLYHLREDMAAAREAMATARESLEACRREHGAHEGEVEARRRALAALVRERLALEKRAAKAASDRAKKAPALARAQEESARLERRVEAGRRELEAARRRRDEQGERLQRLEAELARVVEERQQLDSSSAAAADGEGGGGAAAAGGRGRSRSRTGGGANAANATNTTTTTGLPAMDEAQLQEYRRLREEAGVRTSLLEGERDTLKAEQRADEQALSQQRSAAAQLRARAEERRALAEAAASRASAARAESVDAKKLAKAKRAERERVSTEAMTSQSRREEAAQHLAALERKLSEARSERRQTERERRQAEAAAMLKREVPGVHGRLTDLSRVTARKYGLALAVALGHNLDAIVVDSRAVAFACIDQLVSRRLERMEFIPLDSCDARPVDEALRGLLPPGARLAIDLLEFEPHLGRAFQYALG